MKSFYTLLLFVLLTGCHELRDPLEIIDPNDVVKMEIVNNDLQPDKTLLEVKADSISSRLIKVSIGTEADAEKPVKFVTTAGVLTLPGERPMDSSSRMLTVTPSNRELVIQLNVLDVPEEEVFVTASIGTITNSIKFKFVPALPKTFYLTPAYAKPALNDIVTVNVVSVCDKGKVSENIYFNISVTAPDSIKMDFPKVAVLKNQKSSFQMQNLSGKTGSIKVRVTMDTEAQKNFSDEVDIVYN